MPETLQQQTAKLLAHSNYYIPHDISKLTLFRRGFDMYFYLLSPGVERSM